MTRPFPSKQISTLPSVRSYPDPEHFEDMSRLGEEITEMAAHLAAGTCHLLELIQIFDEEEGWCFPGIASCANWLNWKCSMSSYSFKVIITGSASWEVVGRKARLAGNGWSLPRGVTPRTTASQLARREVPRCPNTVLQPLRRTRPFFAVCALSWNIWVPLNPQLSP
jgi:hypothetical protein